MTECQIGQTVQALRRAQGRSLTSVARSAGIAKGYLSEIERGREARISADVLYRLAVTLNTTMERLLDRPVLNCSAANTEPEDQS